MFARLVLSLIVLALAGGCAHDEGAPPAGMPDMPGTVRYIPLEGGFYGIIGDDGKQYDPESLPQAFQRDGLRVWFRARPSANQMSTRQWGMRIVVEKIENAK